MSMFCLLLGHLDDSSVRAYVRLAKKVPFYQDEMMVPLLYSLREAFLSDPMFDIVVKVKVIPSEMSFT